MEKKRYRQVQSTSAVDANFVIGRAAFTAEAKNQNKPSSTGKSRLQRWNWKCK